MPGPMCVTPILQMRKLTLETKELSEATQRNKCMTGDLNPGGLAPRLSDRIMPFWDNREKGWLPRKCEKQGRKDFLPFPWNQRLILRTLLLFGWKGRLGFVPQGQIYKVPKTELWNYYPCPGCKMSIYSLKTERERGTQSTEKLNVIILNNPAWKLTSCRNWVILLWLGQKTLLEFCANAFRSFVIVPLNAQ